MVAGLADLAYEDADLSPVQTLYIPDPSHPDQAPAAFRYPRAGTPNAVVRLGLIPRTGGPTTWIDWDQNAYPYLARVAWPQNAPLTLLVQARPQKTELLLAADPATGATHTLLSETDPAWLNLDPDTRIPRWQDDGHAFFWSTERHGDWQLELRDKSGHFLRASPPSASTTPASPTPTPTPSSSPAAPTPASRTSTASR